jgi:hypothetical protein
MNQAKIFFRRNPAMGKCPSCKSIGTLNKSHSRTVSEKIVKNLTFYRLYKCKECDWRGFLAIVFFTSRSVFNLLLYLILFSFAGYVIYKLLHYLLG